MFSLRLARNVYLNRLIPSYETVRASVTTDAFFFLSCFFSAHFDSVFSVLVDVKIQELTFCCWRWGGGGVGWGSAGESRGSDDCNLRII